MARGNRFLKHFPKWILLGSLALSGIAWSDSRPTLPRAKLLDPTSRTSDGWSSTLDPALTQSTHHLLTRAKPVRAAAMLVEVKTGRVLAAAEIGTSGPDLETASLLLDPVSPAASVMKLFTTAALYESTDVTPRTKVCSRGAIRLIEEEHLHTPSGAGIQCQPFGQALATSRNAAYAQLVSKKLAPADLRATAESLGMNQPLLLEGFGRAGALGIPEDPLAYARTAAGFGDSRLSVGGAAQLALTIAAGGRKRALHFLSAPPNAPGSLPEYEPTVLKKTTARRLTRSMEMTVEFGTAREAFLDESGHPYLPSIPVAGKTGTLRPDKQGTTASWFVGFAPSTAPEVVVSVVLWNSDLWHQKGNMVARDLLRAYFAARGKKGVSSPL